MEILTKSPVVFAVASTIGLILTSDGAEVVLHKVPPLTIEQTAGYPQNLARYHLGAQLEMTPKSQPSTDLQISPDSNNAAEAALLCDDPTVGYPLPTGQTTLLVSFPKIENVGSISFLNSGAKGEVTVATSSAKLPGESPQWQTALREQLSLAPIQAAIGPSESKYVRVSFNVTEPGRIYGFGIYSSARVSDFVTPRPRTLALQDRSDSFALIAYN
ncbi:MAG: hypothetical protein H0V18_09830, partial [Pyrinomonadaceae bacterium]|nr:hypothetical protein [Pyrinomonadaceae bacterium]